MPGRKRATQGRGPLLVRAREGRMGPRPREGQGRQAEEEREEKKKRGTKEEETKEDDQRPPQRMRTMDYADTVDMR
eukprot:7619435-Lingulodinium_polyedra.AAC.1